LIVPENTGPSSSLLTIPERFQNREVPDRGRVVAMSGRPVTKKGIVTEVEFKIGDRVLVRKFSGFFVDYGGQKYFSVPQHDVLAILE
jgi:co-chaperonin GroES (HSP10)